MCLDTLTLYEYKLFEYSISKDINRNLRRRVEEDKSCAFAIQIHGDSDRLRTRIDALLVQMLVPCES